MARFLHSLRRLKPIVRNLCYPSIPLTEPVGSLQSSLINRDIANHSSGKTSITSLDCGLRIATEESFGQYCTVGGMLCIIYIQLSPFSNPFTVFVDAGSRHEGGYPPGITHLLSKLSFMVSHSTTVCDHQNNYVDWESFLVHNTIAVLSVSCIIGGSLSELHNFR